MQEMKELAALVYRDTTSENREFWKNEMGQALREIQQVYDDKIDNMRGELETFYNMKVQHSRTAARQNREIQCLAPWNSHPLTCGAYIAHFRNYSDLSL